MGWRIAAAALLLAGCSGSMQGVTRGGGTPVQVSYRQHFDTGRIAAVIDGEEFRGRPALAAAGDGSGRAALDPLISDFFLGTTYATSPSGAFTALLRGDRGNRLACDLSYRDRSGYVPSGGTGVCRHSDGRIIDISW
ncbi:hypothetical protein [Mangrovicoccus ximenensis]|uniref:hypothetical protein n=1 Tax=Mangrovicoccus ximenensis TaxID=1911570 RepID=UPI000D3D94F5|nr:hypothetical protein [Mangrovicoccus ximenensis]